MNVAQIQRFCHYLEMHREEALRSLTRLEEETRSLDSYYPQDVGDRCITTLSKESLFQRTSGRRGFLRLIEAALARIRLGAFGVCVQCGDDIDLRRLEAVPWTQHCLRCQLGLERGKQLNTQRQRSDQPGNLKNVG